MNYGKLEVVGLTKSGQPIHRAPQASTYYAAWTSVDHANAAVFFADVESVEGHGYDMCNFHNSMMGALLQIETGRDPRSGAVLSFLSDAGTHRKRARKKIREHRNNA